MTDSATLLDADVRESTERLRASLRELLGTLLERAFGVALDAVERAAEAFDDLAARGGGVKVNALFGAATAALQGRSPIWGAAKAALDALSPAAKTALVLALVLAVLLLPVTVVLLLLFLIVLAVVLAARAGR